MRKGFADLVEEAEEWLPTLAPEIGCPVYVVAVEDVAAGPVRSAARAIGGMASPNLDVIARPGRPRGVALGVSWGECINTPWISRDAVERRFEEIVLHEFSHALADGYAERLQQPDVASADVEAELAVTRRLVAEGVADGFPLFAETMMHGPRFIRAMVHLVARYRLQMGQMPVKIANVYGYSLAGLDGVASCFLDEALELQGVPFAVILARAYPARVLELWDEAIAAAGRRAGGTSPGS